MSSHYKYPYDDLLREPLLLLFFVVRSALYKYWRLGLGFSRLFSLRVLFGLLLSWFGVALFTKCYWGDTHVLLKDASEIAWILEAAGIGNLVNTLVAISQTLGCFINSQIINVVKRTLTSQFFKKATQVIRL